MADFLDELRDIDPPPHRPACAGEDPHSFDATTIDDAADALAICSSCRPDVQQWCGRTVRPTKSFFDGVCAGQVYRNGKAMEMTAVPDGLLIDEAAS